VRSISLSWSPPASDGGTAISGYHLYRDGNLLVRLPGTARSFTDAGLGDGESHTYALSTVNAVGEGPQSIASTATHNLPGAPRALAATPDVRAVQLSWLAPASDGGSGITWYVLYRDGEVLVSVPASRTSYTDSGLANAATHSYSVAAVTAVGEGPRGASASGTTFVLPSAPQAFSARPDVRAIHLSWLAPASDGGSGITGYALYRDGAVVATLPPSATSYMDAGLGNAATHGYTVSAITAVGEGPRSESASATTFDLPTAPQGLSATPDVRAIHLSWSAPASNGGSGITGYALYRDGRYLVTLDGSTTNYVDAGLGNGETHSYSVSAVSAVGEGRQGASASATTFDAPSAPRRLKAEPGQNRGEIRLQWQVPASDGGTAITGYRLHRGTDADHLTLVAEVTGRAFTDQHLDPLTTYYYRVTAVNAAGESPLSERADSKPAVLWGIGL
jgi:hypothetical protein